MKRQKLRHIGFISGLLLVSCSVVEHEFAFSESPDRGARVSLRWFYILPDYTVTLDILTKSLHKRVTLSGDRMPVRSEIFWGRTSVSILTSGCRITWRSSCVDFN